MNKLTDIFDELWLNLLAILGSITILVGFLLGWNTYFVWKIIISACAVIVVYWVGLRFVKVYKRAESLSKKYRTMCPM